MEETARKTVVIVEDDEAIANLLLLILQDETSYRGIHVGSGTEALRLLQAVKADLYVLDYRLPDMTGLQVYDRIVEQGSGKPIHAILTTAHAGCQIGDRPNITFLPKPFELDDFLEKLDILLEHCSPPSYSDCQRRSLGPP